MNTNDIFLDKWQGFSRGLLESLTKQFSENQNEYFFPNLSAYKLQEYSSRLKILTDLSLWPTSPLKNIFELFKLNPFEKFCFTCGYFFKNDWDIRNWIFALHGDSKNGLLLLFCEKIFEYLNEQKNLQRTLLQIQLLGLETLSGVEIISINPLISEYIKTNGNSTYIMQGTSRININEETTLELGIQNQIALYLNKVKNLKQGRHLLILKGKKLSGKKTQIALAAKKNGTNVLLVDFSSWKDLERNELEKAVYNICLQLALENSWLCFEHITNDEVDKKNWSSVIKILKSCVNFFCVATNSEIDFLTPECYVTAKFNLNEMETKEVTLCWQYFLSHHEINFEDINTVAPNFSLTIGQIKQAVEQMQLLNKIDLTQVFNICQMVSRNDFKGKAHKMNHPFKWSDLIVTEECKNSLQIICDLAKLSNKIYGECGFGKKIGDGRSISALFYGVPGTGKTMAAQVIANEIGLPLYKVDISQIVNKYIGETEKNLKIIFDAAKKSNVILFFDEADALFAKRTQITTANDRFANVETSFLLQEIENYSGIVILATNLLSNFDDAFKRRIKVLVNFVFPDEQMRTRLWQQAFPEEINGNNLDLKYLAEKFEISGSTIKSAALLATFFCVKDKTSLLMEHLLKALEIEMRKSGQLITGKKI
ncbi:MAG: AAA family ATPase [Oscillospiraceae bacterium]|jgi:AAA+ superfamily predicted ATPase|nr:AAA family ATPase [Oscillospiraceae bacterium]